MAAETKPVRPIYVIKKKRGHSGHHGGAWKVAYADFVTAMMSLFIVLWLLNSAPQVKQAVAGYFNDPSGSGKEAGTKILGSGETVSIDKTNVKHLKEEIQKAIIKQKDLDKLAKQVEVTVTADGLKIELIEEKGGTFFESGSAKLNDSGVRLLQVLAGQLRPLPNRLSIEGHTDATPFVGDADYSNWELSSDRANAARRVLNQNGLGDSRISQVRGYASQMLRVATNPLDPANRRISLIVQWLETPAPTGAQDTHDTKIGAGAPKSGESEKSSASPDPGKPEKSASPGEPQQSEKTGEEPNAKPGIDDKATAKEADTSSAKPKPQDATAATTAAAKPSMIDRLKSFLPGKKAAAPTRSEATPSQPKAVS